MPQVLLLESPQEDSAALDVLKERGIEARAIDGGAIRRALAHDMRNPLGVILGNAELLREGVYGDLTAKQVASLATIERQAERLAEMMAELADQLQVERDSG